jgi:uncharacterized protein (DUF305 family)
MTNRVRSLLGAALLALPCAPVVAQSAAPAPATLPARYTAADVAFMQGMIGHHAQALTMSALVAGRSAHPQMPLLAERIAVSQQDEIAIMRRWLEERQLPVPAAAAGEAHAAHADHGAQAAHDMPGMLSPAQMDSLSKASGVAFDKLFLQYMMQHHEGALVMVAQLLASPDAARDPLIYQFASDVDTDQRAEIRRMRAMFATM